MERISTFDDWIDMFELWQRDIGLDDEVGRDYLFETKFSELTSEDIVFGDFRGERRWETVMEIPDQRIRDALEHLIVYQGDTEFASVEQQRALIETAPTDYDRQALIRVMREEMRHGWQMCYLLVKHFGHSGRIEARKQLERRAFEQDRLLGSFNETVDHWLDFFTYTQFIDRDGKYQLQMLTHSGFAPLARSTRAMLKEESFHLGTGNNGLQRIVKAGRIPTELLQKYFNKWIPTAFDLFGKDQSGSANWAYVWGLKARYDETTNPEEADKERLNEHARELYRREITELVDRLNVYVPPGSTPLYVPDMRFNRRIGDFAHQHYSVQGEELTAEESARHRDEVLPSAADDEVLADLTSAPGWIASKSA